MLQFIFPVDITVVLSKDEYLESPEDITSDNTISFNALITSRKDIHLIYASIDNYKQLFKTHEEMIMSIHVGEVVFCSVQGFEEWYDTEYLNRKQDYFKSIQSYYVNIYSQHNLLVLTVPKNDIKDL